MPTAEVALLLEMIDQAFDHRSWHGTNLKGSIKGVTAREAMWRPGKDRHNIWELVLHIDLYVRIVLDATNGIPMPRLFGTEKDWPPAGRC